MLGGWRSSLMSHSCWKGERMCGMLTMCSASSTLLPSSYKKEFVECCEHLLRVGLGEKEKREEEVRALRHSHEEACTANQRLSAERVRQYEEDKLKVVGPVHMD